MTKIWINHKVQDGDNPALYVHDRGFQFGDGLFETVRLQAGKPCFWDQHLARLAAGCAVLRLPVPQIDLPQILADLGGHSDGAMRLTYSRGPAPRGVLPPSDPVPTLTVQVFPPAPALPPARCIFSQTVHRNEQSPLARIKSLNYGDSLLARLEAADAGVDDAILLNTAGYVAEATAANLFVVLDGRLMTPPVLDGALPGVMRGEVIRRFGAMEARLTSGDLRVADGLFLTSSLSIRPVVGLGGRALEIHPLTQKVMAAFF
jgi:branched-chain amino acid aminotransferase